MNNLLENKEKDGSEKIIDSLSYCHGVLNLSIVIQPNHNNVRSIGIDGNLIYSEISVLHMVLKTRPDQANQEPVTNSVF